MFFWVTVVLWENLPLEKVCVKEQMHFQVLAGVALPESSCRAAPFS